MSKHTPGLWTTEPHGNTTALYSGRGEHQHGMRLMNLDDGDWNFEANARLIEAAPDLLSALEMLTDATIQLAPYPPEVAEGVVAMVEIARAAIAKAKGEAK